MNCKKCNGEFEQRKGLLNYCSLKCRNSKIWTDEDKLKKSVSAKQSEKVKIANALIALKNKGKRYFRKQGGNCSTQVAKQSNRITNTCPVCKKDIISVPSRNQKFHNECYKTVSGGYKKNSGRGKYGWYKGYWCQSSYELAFVIYHIDHNIKFERNKEAFEYKFDDKIYKYFPDFKINDKFVEVKGYYTNKVYAKIDCLKNSLVVYDKLSLKPIFEYVYKNYGRDYISLYEDSPYNFLSNICEHCKQPCKKRNKFCDNVCSAKYMHIKKAYSYNG